MATPVRAVVIGATGRMGLAIVRAAQESEELRIVAAIASAKSVALGRDIGELAGLPRLDVEITSDLPAALEIADVAIDFSQPVATYFNLDMCRMARKPLLIGTTGFTPDVAAEFDSAAQDIPLLVAPNTSIGVTLLIELVRACAQALPKDFDIEIVEAHHRMKKDSPSGTALALGRAAAEGRQQDFNEVAAIDRGREFTRKEGDIGFAAIRGGDIVGEHSVLFAGTGEQVVLGHRATDRAIFARGAVQAATWLVGKGAGRFFMRDVIGYKSAG